MKSVVTGGTGKGGRAVVRDLLAHDDEVLNVDLIPSRDPLAPFLPADLTDYGQTLEALSGAEVMSGDGARRLRAVPRLLGRPLPAHVDLWSYVDESHVEQSGTTRCSASTGRGASSATRPSSTGASSANRAGIEHVRPAGGSALRARAQGDSRCGLQATGVEIP